MGAIEETMLANNKGREALAAWKNEIKKNTYQIDSDFKHSISFYLADKCPSIDKELTEFADRIVNELEPLVAENNLAQNLPRIEPYDGIGRKNETIVHHPTYEAAGNIIYGSGILRRMANPGGLLEALTFMFLSSQAGEAGHNCPVACSAGIIRVLQKFENIPNRKTYIDKLIDTSYTSNFTGAQFLTEVQGGSDVGLNAAEAYQDEHGKWRIRGEKWFCSNADAELILLTARFDKSIPGTKGLGLFLIPARLESGERNAYTLRRLKDKIGTRSMASGEIDFHGAYAIPVGPLAEGFKTVMENVLHISRLFNTFCVIGMARRAYHIANGYSQHRIAFGRPIISYPLVKENLARIKAENTALLASIFATTQLQDDFDMGKEKGDEVKLLLRLLANINKYLSAIWSVDHIHHSLDVLAGNGAIESFSSIPRLLRDIIVCENWEGTHNTLRMQIFKDIERYKIDEIFVNYMEGALVKAAFEEKYRAVFKQGLSKLKEDLQIFKSADPELKSLQIKSIVDQMGILYAALHLLSEALGKKGLENNSKRFCFDYLMLLHMNKHGVLHDSNHLDLIKAVAGDSTSLI